MKASADFLAEGKEQVQQVRDGTLDPTNCTIRVCPLGISTSRLDRAKLGSVELLCKA